MGIAEWMRVLDAVGGLAQLSRKLRPRAPEEALQERGSPGVGGALETRLAGVVVAALKEAFDRDRQRMELERAHVDAERRRAEEALAAELRRQASERTLEQLRLIAVMAIAAWMLSAALAVWLPGMRAGAPRALLGLGWVLSFATLGCVFSGWQQISAWQQTSGWTGATTSPQGAASSLPQGAAPWMLLAALAAIGASLLAAL